MQSQIQTQLVLSPEELTAFEVEKFAIQEKSRDGGQKYAHVFTFQTPAGASVTMASDAKGMAWETRGTVMAADPLTCIQAVHCADVIDVRRLKRALPVPSSDVRAGEFGSLLMHALRTAAGDTPSVAFTVNGGALATAMAYLKKVSRDEPVRVFASADTAHIVIVLEAEYRKLVATGETPRIGVVVATIQPRV